LIYRRQNGASKSLAIILAAILAGVAVAGYELFEVATTTTSITTTLTSQSTSYSGTLTTITTASGATISSPIQHVIIIMQENRAFDNFFWTWPGQIGYNASLCMPLNPSKPEAGCMKPQYTTDPVSRTDLPHTWTSSWKAYNKGSMNGFLSAAGDNAEVMSYYNSSVVSDIWSLAAHYVLADQWFTSAKSYSQPNHWYLIAAQAPNVSLFEDSTTERSQCVNFFNQLVMATCAYINEAQPIQTMADELSNYGLTWKYYDAPLPKGYTLAEGITGSCSSCNPWDYWSPLRAQNRTWTNPVHFNSMVARGEFFSDLQNDTLPDVSWIIPSAAISDHPPANVTLGEWWITDLVDAVMNSQYWKNSLIVILWDDYGGYFDTVVPPTVDAAGLSFRCPAIIVSPYAKTGYLDSTVYSFESTLKFIEWNWNLPALSSRDANANNLLNALNFNQLPLSPSLVPLTAQQQQTIAPYIAQGSTPNPNPNGNQSLTDSLAFINNDPD